MLMIMMNADEVFVCVLMYILLQTMRALELILQQKLNSDRSKYLPPIKRGGYIDIYMTSSG